MNLLEDHPKYHQDYNYESREYPQHRVHNLELQYNLRRSEAKSPPQDSRNDLEWVSMNHKKNKYESYHHPQRQDYKYAFECSVPEILSTQVH